MQLPLPADVLVPIGVGVLVAVVAVIALVLGLRRKVEDAPVPSDDDWTSEHVGDVVPPPTRTVADAVAERQGNTGPFVVAPGSAVRLPALGPVVSASVVARRRQDVRAAARTASVALAEPGEIVAEADPSAEERPVNGTGLRAQAGHVRPGDDDRAAFPADPLFGAGRFDQIGPDGDPWFTPPSMPRTHRGGPGGPTGPDEGSITRPEDASEPADEQGETRDPQPVVERPEPVESAS